MSNWLGFGDRSRPATPDEAQGGLLLAPDANTANGNDGNTNINANNADARGNRSAATRAFAGAGARVQGLRQNAHDRLQAARESVDRGDYKNLSSSLGLFVKDRLDVAQMRAAGFGDVGAKLAERRRVAQEALLNLSGPLRAKVMLALRENVKAAALADKDMPMCLKRRLAGGIDLVWDDITLFVDNSIEDVKDVVRGKRITNIEELGRLGEDSKPVCCSPRWWRAFLLYKFLPFDMSIFGQMKDFWFWVFLLASCIPAYGIRVCFFIVLLICELTGCPPDEYQLVQYILMFKGCQFLSSGVCMSVYVALKYFLCVHPDGEHTCHINGPAATQSEFWAVFDIFGSCILVWLVFWILPRSTRSAGERDIAKKPQDDSDVDEEDTRALEKRPCCGCDYQEHRGGRMRFLLRYDLVCFILSLLFFALLSTLEVLRLKPGESSAEERDERLAELKGEGKLQGELKTYWLSYENRIALYWTRIFYSALSAPFFIFYLPVINGILTHTTPTGYNRFGVCVPFMMPPAPDEGALDSIEEGKEM